MIMKQIYTYIGAGLVALSFTNLIACTEIEHGVNDIDTWEEVKDYTEALNHPCMLHTQEDFDFVKGKLQAGQQPWHVWIRLTGQVRNGGRKTVCQNIIPQMLGQIILI